MLILVQEKNLFLGLIKSLVSIFPPESFCPIFFNAVNGCQESCVFTLTSPVITGSFLPEPMFRKSEAKKLAGQLNTGRRESKTFALSHVS